MSLAIVTGLFAGLTKKGTPIFSGKTQQAERFVVLPNPKAGQTNQPDYYLYKEIPDLVVPNQETLIENTTSNNSDIIAVREG